MILERVLRVERCIIVIKTVEGFSKSFCKVAVTKKEIDYHFAVVFNKMFSNQDHSNDVDYKQ